MDPLLALLNTRLDRLNVRLVAVGVAVLAIVLAAAGTAAASVPWVQNVLGGLAGMALFLAGYIVVTRLLPADWRERLDIRSTWPLPRRRWASIWILLLWLTGIYLVTSNVTVPLTLLGATNVAVLMMVWRIGSSTELERLLLEEDDEEWPADADEGYDEDGAGR